MIDNKTNRRVGALLQYGQMALNVIINLVYTPIMLRILGSSEYGIYNIASSAISYLGMLSLGFGSSYIRFYSRYAQTGDEQGVRRLNGLYLFVFALMGAVALAAGIIISCNVSLFFNETYTPDDLAIARKLMVLLAVNLAISFPASVFVSYISSQQKFIFQKLMNIGKTVFSPCLSIAILFLGHGSVGMAVVTTVVSLLVDICNVLYCLCKLKMRFSFGKPDFALFRSIAAFSFFIALNQITDQINWQTDKIILGKMINATAVAIYGVAAQLNSMYINMSLSVSSVFTPKIHKIVNSDAPEEEQNRILTDLFVKVGRIQYAVLMLILTGFIFFGQYFVRKWAGADFGASYYIALLLMVPTTIPSCQNLGIEIQRARNKHQFRSLVYFGMALLNVGISIVLTRYFGVIGVAAGTTISLLLANGLVMNIYYHKVMHINVILFWRNLLRMSLGLLIPVAAGIFVLAFVPISSLWQFILFIMAYGVVYALSMWFFGLNGYEKNLCFEPIRKLKGRKNATHEE